ncbi:MAG: hypothetical protein RML95_11850 [Anaerolineae bacterium]|nr:hypothetical protein [Anaerolineae bacterium]MDW8300016.1 hypothetical protein [Anaerolineae bacterium]
MDKRKYACRSRLWLIAGVAILLAACNIVVPRDESAAALLPNLRGYTVENTLNITDALTKAGAGAALAGGQAQFAAAIGAVGSYVTCLQRAGALEGRVYIQQENPLKSGLVMIINRNKISDPQTLLGCAIPQAQAMRAESVPEYSFCANLYTLQKNNNEFYIMYAASSPQVCEAFCTALEGCR